MMTTSGNGGKMELPVWLIRIRANCADEDFTVRGSAPMLAYDGKDLFYGQTRRESTDRSYDGDTWISSDSR